MNKFYIKETLLNDLAISNQEERYLNLYLEAINNFGEGIYYGFSSPGRSEIIGNHTDHQRGCVIGAAINADILAFAKKNNDNTVNLISQGKTYHVNLNDLSIKEEEKNTSSAIIRGVAALLKEDNKEIAGFDCICNSDIASGSGLSSSAAFELLIAQIFNYFFNNNSLNNLYLALLSQKCENLYFGKPSGCADQIAIACGGVSYMDLKDEVKLENLDFSFSKHNYRLTIINCEADHKDLTDEYASITKEMKMVANYFNKNYLREVEKEQFFSNINMLNKEINNQRAILRAFHFFNEQDRVALALKAFKEENINQLLKLINLSGESSYKYLQNVIYDKSKQEYALLYGLAKEFNQNGSTRVHGGGFGGTIACVVKKEDSDIFNKNIEDIYGNCLHTYEIRKAGSTCLGKVTLKENTYCFE